MTEFFNRRSEKDKRRALRRRMTPAEAHLWQRLRDRQAGGCKFRRQHSAGFYILDFYCPACRLAVELDGASHDSEDARAYDAGRTDYLAAAGIRVIRFANALVFQDLDGVVRAVQEEGRPHPGASADPLLPKGEGEDSGKGSDGQ